MGCERLYCLSAVEDFSDQEPLVDRLKRIVDKYGEVVVTIGASHIPFWIEYDPDIVNIHSKVHAFTVIGYNEKAFYILEDEKYIGQGYITADFNPTIGLIKFSDMVICSVDSGL